MSNEHKYKVSNPKFWEESYKTNNIGWDIGYPTPIFNDWIKSQKKSLKICVLGAGNGWDALNFTEKGHYVTAVDFAVTAINNMKFSAKKRNIKLNIVNSNIFDLEKIYYENFDVVVEYTCFCAIHPTRRVEYIKLVNNILKPNGKIVGIFFPIGKKINNNGPPYNINLRKTVTQFSKYFKLIERRFSHLSIEPRKGREILTIFQKYEENN